MTTAALTVTLAPDGQQYGSRALIVKPTDVYWLWTREEGADTPLELVMVLPSPIKGYPLVGMGEGRNPQPPKQRRWWQR